jgi:glycosyltransferase involved in cell wall biosynthesis
MAVYLRAGRRQLRELAPRAQLGFADSAYNAAELDALGYERTSVVPILFDRNDLHVDVDAATRDRLERERIDGSSTWLFVGQVAPHKAQHDVVKALAMYRRLFDPRARLRLVGFPLSKAYVEAVEHYAADLGLSGAVEIAGSVPDAVLGAYFAASDVYVCLSEHEGFCVPLLEAMHHSLPVVAYAAGAVPETLGSGGLLLSRKDPLTVATAVARVMAAGTRDAFVRAGHERLDDFSLARNEAALLDAVASVAGRP